MASNRIAICWICGAEIESRNGFAHITVYNHIKKEHK